MVLAAKLDRTTPDTSVQATVAGALPVATVVGAGIFLAGRVPETALLALAVVIGLPHGALDHLVGRRAFGGRHGPSWWRPFLAGYLGLASATLLLWWALPGGALILFLGLALLHFGDEDAPREAPGRILRIAAHGGAVIVVPAASHRAAVQRLFAMLAPDHTGLIEALLSGPLMAFWVVAAAVTLAIYAACGRDRDRAAALDLVLVTLLFVSATPLIAFALYFAAIHTPRAFRAALPYRHRSIGPVLVPVLLTLLALALGSAIFLAGVRLPIADDVVRSTFLLLSALTVPHMWLARRAQLASGSATMRVPPPFHAAGSPLEDVADAHRGERQRGRCGQRRDAEQPAEDRARRQPHAPSAVSR